MSSENSVLNSMEKIVFELRKIYASYGYAPYKMSKFEEYDLYSGNKDFLISDGVITFTDRNGKLMALKPDVTLSIVKNNSPKPGSTRKLYYDENVYRVARGGNSFKEIMQSGLECIGAVDDYLIGEVLLVAAKSLQVTGRRFVLDVCQMDLLLDFLGKITDSAEVQDRILKCVSEKNIHGIDAILLESDIEKEKADALKKLLALYGKADKVLPEVKKLAEEMGAVELAEKLEAALSVVLDEDLAGDVNIDFSVVSDRNYYNGITFRGFVEGVPNSVLSGGQYDVLMKKMGRKAGAIGFAVYMDLLERLIDTGRDYDFDLMLLYDDTSSVKQIAAFVKEQQKAGKRVLAARNTREKQSYREIAKMENGEVTILENND